MIAFTLKKLVKLLDISMIKSIFNLIFGGFLLLAPNLRCEVETASRDIAEGNEAATEVTTPTYPGP